MAQGNPEKEQLYSRQQSINSELSQASQEIANAENQINSLDGQIGGLAGRLTEVRGKGYSALAHLDKTTDLLTKKWAASGPAVKQAVLSGLQPLRSEVSSLESRSQNLRMLIDANDFGAANMLAMELQGQANSLRSQVNQQVMNATAPVRDMAGSFNSVDRDLKIAETSMALFANAAFPMQQQEYPVLAVEGKIMEGEKSHGTLYFTNRRFVFEGLKEVALEKHLFIVTKKKIERVSEIDLPIGALRSVTKGRVGLIAGTGVFVEFKPDVNRPQNSFDVKAWEADVITRFHQYVLSGEADKDIAAVKGIPATTATATIQIVRCSSCGAPHTGEIFKGQTSVKCEYCGTEVAISGM